MPHTTVVVVMCSRPRQKINRSQIQVLCRVAQMHFFFPLHQWRIIAGGTKCIPKSELPLEDDDPQVQPAAPPSSRLWLHPSDLSIALSASTPLYPPGRIIHVVHNHPPETW